MQSPREGDWWRSYWDQPGDDDLVFDERGPLDVRFVYMTERSFQRLKDYSASVPSGAFVGKRWKRDDGSFDPYYRGPSPNWVMGEYAPGSPGNVRILWRKIEVISDEEFRERKERASRPPADGRRHDLPGPQEPGGATPTASGADPDDGRGAGAAQGHDLDVACRYGKGGQAQ